MADLTGKCFTLVLFERWFVFGFCDCHPSHIRIIMGSKKATWVALVRNLGNCDKWVRSEVTFLIDDDHFSEACWLEYHLKVVKKEIRFIEKCNHHAWVKAINEALLCKCKYENWNIGYWPGIVKIISLSGNLAEIQSWNVKVIILPSTARSEHQLKFSFAFWDFQ